MMQQFLQKGASKLLQFYWRRTRALTIGAQGMVFDTDRNVLLVRHAYRPGWHFPGGGVERGESVLCSLRRELDEEAGVKFCAKPDLFGIYANFKAFPGDHIVLFVVRDWRQDAVPAPNGEIAEQRFVALDNLPDGTVPAVKRRLGEVVGNAERISEW